MAQGYKAYANAQSSAVSSKELERMALAKSTRKLTDAQLNFKIGQAGYSAYADAIKFNQKLWTLIQSNISDNPDVGSQEFRTNFLQVSLFVDRQSFKALQEPYPENLAPLIKVNKNISNGLYEVPAAPAPSKTQYSSQNFEPSL